MITIIEIVMIFLWIHFLIAALVAVLLSKEKSKIFGFGGGAIFIWLIFPYKEDGTKTNSDTIIWWVRISFIIAIGASIYKQYYLS